MKFSCSLCLLNAARCCFVNLENGRMSGRMYWPVHPLVLIYNSMANSERCAVTPCSEKCQLNISISMLSSSPSSGFFWWDVISCQEKPELWWAQIVKACERKEWKLVSVKASECKACLSTFIFGFKSPALQFGVCRKILFVHFLSNLILVIKYLYINKCFWILKRFWIFCLT